MSEFSPKPPLHTPESPRVVEEETAPPADKQAKFLEDFLKGAELPGLDDNAAKVLEYLQK